MITTLIKTKNLTKKEAEIAQLIIEGLSSKQIGNKLFVSEKTIKNHITSIYLKFEVKSRGQLMGQILTHVLNLKNSEKLD